MKYMYQGSQTNVIELDEMESFFVSGLQPGNYAFDVSSYGCEGPFSGQVRAQITGE